MSQTRANILMLIATLIWGTAFVSQTTGMGSIGPFTFSFSRFFFATITVLPLALYFERNNFAKIFSNSKLLILTIATGVFLFLGMGLQQYALQVSQISNVAFITTLYVPIVGIISRFVFKSQLHWIIWIAILLCVLGSYLLSSNQSIEIQQSDSLIFIAAFCFAVHIILIDMFMKQFNILNTQRCKDRTNNGKFIASNKILNIKFCFLKWANISRYVWMKLKLI